MNEQLPTDIASDRRSFERVSVDGAAAVLDFGYLGTVYAIGDLSLGGARLIGPRRPPDTSFEILLHVSNCYLECRARQVWDDRARDGSLGIEFENVDARTSLDGNWTPEHHTEWADRSERWNRNAARVFQRVAEQASRVKYSMSAGSALVLASH
jgi:hypothetical protein